MNDRVRVRLLKALEKGDAVHWKFRNGRYMVGSKKPCATISKVNLPAFYSQYAKNKTITGTTKAAIST